LADPLGLEAVRRALAEDCVDADVTTCLLGPAAERPATARLVAEGRFVVAGLPIAALVFRELAPRAELTAPIGDGDWVDAEAAVATVAAPARALLAGERVALNFLQRLSGGATQTRRAVDAVAGTGCRITHTRKTTPGLRALECYAVRAAGGVSNRASLAEAVMWKDNHWALLNARGASLADVLRVVPPGRPVVVEIETDRQLEEALKAGATHVLVDNQPPERVAAWVRQAGPAVTVEASGGITPDTARAYAQAGARLISIGALTHSAPAAPIRCDISW